MRRVLLQRLGQAALVVALVVTLCFLLIRLAPGDPFFAALDMPDVPADASARMAERFGYDRPLPEQYVRYIGGLLQGDLGWSHSRARPVAEVLRLLLPNTLLLMGAALLVGMLGGIIVGALQGWHAESPLARWSDRVSLVLVSIPEFVLGLFLALTLALSWRLLPVGGMRTEFGPSGLAGLVDVLWHLVLPAGTLALGIAAVVARHQRAAVRALRRAAFIRAGRAAGLHERSLLWRYALRPALAPVLTVMGVLLATLVSGAVLVERIFAWPGMGRAVVEAVLYRDYPLVAGAVLVTSVGVVLATLLADIAVWWADPRAQDRL